MAIPNKLTQTRGKRQYPRMLADRASVNVDEKWRLPEGCSGVEAWLSSGAMGGAINEKMALRATLPIKARP
jgi:hypothetical protein